MAWLLAVFIAIVTNFTIFHCVVRLGSARVGSVLFPPQFSVALEWVGLFTCRYSCAVSIAVTSS